MRDLRELRMNSRGGWAVTRPLTAEGLRSVEELVGKRLPSGYVEFLRFSNGGYPELDTFEYESVGGQREWSGTRFFHVSADPGSTEGVIWNHRNWYPGAPHTLLPIAENGFGDYLLLDLANDKNDRIVIWWHEIPDEEQSFDHTGLSFEQMIDRLTRSPDADL